ncbi:hypothetical protein [Roseibium suaedae]|nr:hypothetical protein [Roseibium suaedae]
MAGLKTQSKGKTEPTQRSHNTGKTNTTKSDKILKINNCWRSKMQQLHRDIYIKLKDEKLPSKNDINEIDRFFFGPHEEISYYTILSYGLLNRANEKNIKRVKDLISIFIENEEDDLLRAVIMTTYIYWNSGDSISNELIYFLKNCCMETFSEASLSAASSLADSAFQNKNEEILKNPQRSDCDLHCIRR